MVVPESSCVWAAVVIGLLWCLNFAKTLQKPRWSLLPATKTSPILLPWLSSQILHDDDEFDTNPCVFFDVPAGPFWALVMLHLNKIKLSTMQKDISAKITIQALNRRIVMNEDSLIKFFAAC